ncbi:MAG: hypothetical protein AAGA18_00305 [Verrucomicrobiota bacterium]
MEDLLPILIFLAIAVFQIIARFFKKKEDPVQPDYEPESKGDDDSWDELMEALGGSTEKKEIKEASAPATPPPFVTESTTTSTPPPIPTTKPATKPVRTLEDIQLETAKKIEAANREAERIKQQSGRKQLQVPKGQQSAYSLPTHEVSLNRIALVNSLKSKNSIRQAIVINELLQPPLALR